MSTPARRSPVKGCASWPNTAAPTPAVSDNVGISLTGFYTRTDGFFENEYTHRTCDREWQTGGRWKMQWDNRRGLRLDNTLAVSRVEQGGYPYAYAGDRRRG